jgi:hypothetical protein
MENLIFFVLASVGLTLILTRSKLLESFRDLFDANTLYGYFVSCPQCMGFWVGSTFSPIIVPEGSGCIAVVFYVIAASCTSSFTSLFFAHLTDYVFWHSTAIQVSINGRTPPQMLPNRQLTPPQPQPQTPMQPIEPTATEPQKKRVVPTVDNPHGVE